MRSQATSTVVMFLILFTVHVFQKRHELAAVPVLYESTLDSFC